jgi:hypothetical protein
MGWGGRRANAGRKSGGKSRRTITKVPLLPARAHRQMVEELPLDILIAAARDKSHPIELRLAAAKAAAPYFHARVSSSLPKASFEMTDGHDRHAGQQLGEITVLLRDNVLRRLTEIERILKLTELHVPLRHSRRHPMGA